MLAIQGFVRCNMFAIQGCAAGAHPFIIHHVTEWSGEVLDLAERFKDAGVVGIDLAGDEKVFGCPTPAPHIAAYQVG